jgi:hypothetical protein
MMTLKDLLTSGVSTSPDGVHWEPALPYPSPLLWDRWRDAWAVFTGKAHAIVQTPKGSPDAD